MQGMRDMLRGTLGRSLRPLPALDRLAAAWPVACGSALAGHGEVSGYEDGIVHIVVASSEWMQPLSHMKLVLQSDLARIAGVPVTAIHFEKAGNREHKR
jgi:predicted nucleic acid-binding Zn ribbon protein